MSLFELISSAQAQTTGAAAPGGTGNPMDMLQQFAPFIVVLGIFYFLMIRPQSQKAKALKAQLSDLRRGDNVITAGGIIGTVARLVNDDEVSLEISEGVRVRVIRSTITGITAKGEPRTDMKSEDTADKPKPIRRGKTPPASAIANDTKPQA